jgi:putative Holliday junction resolvase
VARALGVDLGSRRIGLALSDPTGLLASPLRVLGRSGDRAADHRTIAAIAREADADRIVVGLPLSLSGETGPAARAVLDEVEALRAEVGEGMRVETHDERLTTVIAEQGLRAAAVPARKRRRRVDAAAATVILQSYLDRGSAPAP